MSSVPPSEQTLTGWALVREKINVKTIEFIDDDGNLANTDKRLTRALLKVDESDEGDIESKFEDLTTEDSDAVVEESPSPSSMCKLDWSQFQVTTHVVKFIKNGDAKYREIFVKKMKQLAKGERSHKLQKPLKGCESIICE